MKKYYRIRASVVWITMVVVIIIAALLYFKDDLYQLYRKSNGRETISYVGKASELQNQSECYLCGSSERSMMDYYRKQNTVGVVSINDWHILDSGLTNIVEDEIELETGSGTRSRHGNTGVVEYRIESNLQMGISEMEITLPEDYKLDTAIIQEHLCQSCLDKILEALELNKWKNEKKEVIPLCLIDFQTLKIYSVQEITQKYILDHCYVKVQNKETSSFLFVANHD